MDYEAIASETYQYLKCPYCGTNSACLQVRYGYPSPQYHKVRGQLVRNYWPSQNIWLVCPYCGIEDPEYNPPDES